MQQFFHLIRILGVELKCGRIIHLYNLARTCKKQQQQKKKHVKQKALKEQHLLNLPQQEVHHSPIKYSS